MSNYALDGNPNPTLTRKQAIDYLVDCCLNDEYLEWASCSVKIKSKSEALADIMEASFLAFVKVDSDMLEEVYQTVNDNML